ncbi:hypothetical protein [Myceligenerans pegani]|uniref:Uncharacterized protein n=1 Tax=Myceligenerans pegani TaxID=2776917 RepID=A0ABR9MX78_9MICO|nr:hypothetical protein [Myceligenerans sp. TRM 65318]MBE1875601.1 hypothetical protein [Myceligenerans sp. TRM 65318]MBE3017872.1 hypothetical protein [Myceligenerans sp. TRM 65318]
MDGDFIDVDPGAFTIAFPFFARRGCEGRDELAGAVPAVPYDDSWDHARDRVVAVVR